MSVERTLFAGLATVLTATGALARMPDGPRTLLASLGWDLPPGVDDIGLATLDIGDVGQRLTAWNDLAADPEADEGDNPADQRQEPTRFHGPVAGRGEEGSPGESQQESVSLTP